MQGWDERTESWSKPALFAWELCESGTEDRERKGRPTFALPKAFFLVEGVADFLKKFSMKLVCNTWKEHDELGKVYHTTPKKNRRQVFAFFIFFFDNPYEFESKGKSIAQARSVLHWIITNLRAIKKSWGLQLMSTVVITQKHNASYTLMRWVIGAGRVSYKVWGLAAILGGGENMS